MGVLPYLGLKPQAVQMPPFQGEVRGWSGRCQYFSDLLLKGTTVQRRLYFEPLNKTRFKVLDQKIGHLYPTATGASA